MGSILRVVSVSLVLLVYGITCLVIGEGHFLAYVGIYMQNAYKEASNYQAS